MFVKQNKINQPHISEDTSAYIFIWSLIATKTYFLSYWLLLRQLQRHSERLFLEIADYFSFPW